MVSLDEQKILQNLAVQLRQMMKQENLSLDGMADRLGVSKSSLSKWLAGEVFPRVGQLATMVGLGVDVGSCFQVDEVKPERPSVWGSENGQTWYDHGGREIMERCYDKPYLYELLTYACDFTPELLKSLVELVKGIKER